MSYSSPPAPSPQRGQGDFCDEKVKKIWSIKHEIRYALPIERFEIVD